MCTASEIKETRLALGESQGKFAQHFDVDQSTIHRWETDGPPETGPTRKLIEIVMAGLRQRAPQVAAQ